ncbi:hypothetical protein CW304_05030 [Bacillus sp. UFRGS-B20]|nr:hypothetical protein CW304_05030 [Bacillus sp. UFRGS-B20]
MLYAGFLAHATSRSRAIISASITGITQFPRNTFGDTCTFSACMPPVNPITTGHHNPPHIRREPNVHPYFTFSKFNNMS